MDEFIFAAKFSIPPLKTMINVHGVKRILIEPSIAVAKKLFQKGSDQISQTVQKVLLEI